MNSLHRLGLASGLLTSLLATAAHYQVAGPKFGLFAAAQAQPAPSEEEKKKREQQRKQQPPPKAAPPPPPKAPPPPPPKAPPPPPKAPPPPPKAPPPPPPPPPKAPPPVPKALAPPPSTPGTPPVPFKKDFSRPTPPAPTPGTPPAPPKKDFVRPTLPPPTPGTPPAPFKKDFGSPTPTPSTPGTPPAPFKKDFSRPGPVPGTPGAPPPAPRKEGFVPKGPLPVLTPQPKAPGAPPAFLPKKLDQVQSGRRERVEDGGRRKIIVEPGNRTIIRQDNRVIIRHDEGDRFRFGARDVRTTRLPNGHNETFFLRPDGSRVVTITDGAGRIVRRYRRDPGGREINFIDNRRFYRNAAIGLGVGILGAAILLNLPRPHVDIPRDRYIVDYDGASDDDLYEALTAPPLMSMERPYSLEEIRDNYALRERARSIDLDNVTFQTGSFEVTPEQYGKLERVARAIQRVLEEKPDEVYLIEGHTDRVGTEEDNLSLSDRRAQAVAQVLTEQFGIPPENLVTQGYGEQFPKVDTDGPERRNRRVTVRPIKALMGDETAEQR